MTVNDPRSELAAILAARLARAAEALALALPDSHIGFRWLRNACPARRPGRRVSADPGPSLGSGGSPGSGSGAGPGG